MVSETRSRIMRSVRSKDTGPELRVRSILWRLGVRYRLHHQGLPGRPDIALIGRRKVIFVHGCFWHQHPRCPKATKPKTRPQYWLPKLKRNRQRDKEAERELKKLGWSVLVIWECEFRKSNSVRNKLIEFLSPGSTMPKRSATNSAPPARLSLFVSHGNS
jgi:DNA mismatch endonuclease (patch repair protein)